MIDPLPRIGAGLKLTGVLILTVMWALHASAAPPVLIGKEAPDFVLRGLDGKNRRLSEYRGQVVLLCFWARWASGTREELPALDRINKTYERAGQVVIGVSVDEDETRASEFARSMHLSYPILFETGPGIGQAYSLQKMPVTLLIDRAGVVRYESVGFKRGDDQVYVDQIRELLRE